MNYYNEIDSKAAAWLRELIAQKLIPVGVVDERSIKDITPHELKEFTQCHFFAGIGGWSLALQLAGWPSDRPVWTGSCPCQPFSTAGKGLAQADERHLWPVFFNLIKECRPQHVFGEQVASAIGKGWLDGISADLEAEGYACGATVLGAHSVGAPHIRQRLYWVADSNSGRLQQCDEGIGSVSVVDQNSADGGLGDAGCQCDERRGEFGIVGFSSSEEQGKAREWQRGRDADSDSVQDDCGMEQSNCRGREFGKEQHCDTLPNPSNGDSLRQHADGPSGHLWSDFTLAHCRDGKTRRVPTEPAFFPLAHGIPARVVRLRGYGNAIVPQVAAEFIKACCDVQRDRVLGVIFNEEAFWG